MGKKLWSGGDTFKRRRTDVAGMTFDAPPLEEPADLKPAIAERTAAGEFTLTDEYDWVVPITDPAPGRIIVGTEFAAHVWRAWEDELRRAGFDFPAFVTLVSYSADRIGAWTTDDADWDAVVSDLRERVDELGPTLTADLSPA